MEPNALLYNILKLIWKKIRILILPNVHFLAFLFLLRMTHLTGFKPVIGHKTLNWLCLSLDKVFKYLLFPYQMDTFFLFRLLLQIVEGRVGNGLFWNISEQKVDWKLLKLRNQYQLQLQYDWIQYCGTFWIHYVMQSMDRLILQKCTV